MPTCASLLYVPTYASLLSAVVTVYLLVRLPRWTRHTPIKALAAIVITEIAILLLFNMPVRTDIHKMFAMAAFVLFCCGAIEIVIFATKALRMAWSKWDLDVCSHDAAAKPVATEEERRIILNTLAEGKVTPQEAEELLKAVGEKPGPKTAARWTAGFLAGTLLIVIGFVLPWAHLSHFGPLTGDMSQAGYQQGAIGWIVLVLGVLPAILMCISVLDRHVQLAYLRLILAGCGFALVSPWLLALARFTISLVLLPIIHEQPSEARPGIGIVLVLLGFAAQLLGAAVQSGVLRRKAPKPAADAVRLLCEQTNSKEG